jgi:hypothetical protein
MISLSLRCGASAEVKIPNNPDSMNIPDNQTKTCERLIGLLQEHEILPQELPHNLLRANLFEQGLMDSMGVIHMLELIGQIFGVTIEMDLLVGELTRLDAICHYLDEHSA